MVKSFRLFYRWYASFNFRSNKKWFVGISNDKKNIMFSY